jgi:hypothetical protein
MQKLPFYRANKSNTGVAVSFNFGLNQKKTSIDLYVSSVKQAKWNDSNKTGSFVENAKDPNKTLNMKFSEFEVGGLINTLEKGIPFSAYHKTQAGVTTASARPYIPEKIKKGADWVENTGKVVQGVSLSFKKDGEDAPSFPLTLTFGEATTLAIYLRTGLTEKYLINLAPASGNSAPAPKPTPKPTQDDSGEDAGETSNGNEGGDEDVPF